MSFEEGSPSSPLTPAATRREITIPLDIILHMSGYLKFGEYRSFVRAFWPNGDEVEEVRAKLWELSTRQVTVAFLNGQPISVTYNVNPWRTGDVLLIGVESLSPILGGSFVELLGTFASMPRLHSFVMKHVHMDECSNLRYAACLCHVDNLERSLGRTAPEPPMDPCPDGCFHHYCSRHVRYWLDFYLFAAIRNSP